MKHTKRRVREGRSMNYKSVNRKLLVLTAVFAAVLVAAAVFLFLPAQRYKAQISLGTRFLNSGEYTRAEAAFQEAIRIDSKKADPYMGLGTAYVRQAEDLLSTSMKAELSSGNEEDESAFSGISASQREQILNLFEKGQEAFEEAENYAKENKDLESRLQYVTNRQTTVQNWFNADSDTTAVLKGKKVVIKKKGYTSLLKSLNELSSNDTMNLISSDVSDYPRVKLYFSLESADQQEVLLTSPTAGIVEAINGGKEIERTIRKVEQVGKNEGLGMDILIDKSASMRYDLPNLQTVMTDFINSLNYQAGDAAEIISFDTYLMYMCSYTNNQSNLINGISNMTTYGDTALYDALMTGVQNAGNRTGENCVIAFTDGMDNSSSYTEYEVISLAKQKQIPVYLIGTSNADTAALIEIATETGGRYWDVSMISDVQNILNEIYSRQKELYTIEYESDSNADPYASRTISCVLKDQNEGAAVQAVSFTASEKAQPQKHTSRYELVAGDIPWTEANNAAIAKGGHLATVTSQEEMNRLTSMADQQGLKYIWIGGYTSVRNGQAFGHWMTGEPFDFTAWYPGEPSRNDLDGTPESYVMMWNVNGQWSWNDQRDDVITGTGLDYFRGKMGYIIEYEDVSA